MLTENDRIKNMEQAYHRVKIQRDKLRDEVKNLEERIAWLESHVPEKSDAMFFATHREYQSFQAGIMPDFYSRVQTEEA